MRSIIAVTILYFLLMVSLDSKNSASACGPYFPEHLIRNRVRTLNYLPCGTFAWEVRHLITPPKQLIFRGNSPQNFWDLKECLTKPIGEVFPWLKPAFYEAADSARAATSGQQALELGARLPTDLRLYLSGAAEFRATIATCCVGDSVRLSKALHFFDSIIAQPPKTTRNLIVRATYMRGKCFMHLREYDSAVTVFRSVQKLVSRGYPDLLALGPSSLGEEALALLRQDRFIDAVHCYALQAACTPDTDFLIDPNGSCVQSLENVAGMISTSDSSLFKIAIRDTICQKLFCAGYYSDDWYSRYEHSSDDATCRWNSIVNIIDKYSPTGILGSDMLAAAAYREGCFEAAKKLAARSNTGLAWWVRAKLYIRSGQFKSADIAYAKAVKFYSNKKMEKYHHTWFGDPSGSAPAWTRPAAEYATFEVCRGHYANALKLLYNAGEYYWVDAAYVAERILKIDELKQFVDSVAPDNAYRGEKAKVQYPSNSQLAIRSLLARRLIREGQCDEALKFFDDPRIKPYAVAYCTTFAQSREGSNISRAQSLFRLGKLTRERGMELMGYELDPDWAFDNGMYDEDYDYAYSKARRFNLSQFQPEYIAEDEKRRIHQTEARPYYRFHYRFRAADYALQAAALLPHRSQAYTALLWNAWSWAFNNRDSIYQDSIYKMYLRHGSSKYPFESAIPDFGQ